ncbi:MAG: enoyl-CoA hydratase [Hyphomicrobiales bacterium]|nr:enoyl-CoA hydratase [Hyphomicrobiales bacterium]
MLDQKPQAQPPLIREDHDGVTVLTLNRPRTINALSEDTLDALQKAFEKIAGDHAVKAVILRGAGENFCAGHNLKEMTARRGDGDGGFQYYKDLFASCSRMMTLVVQLPQPVIAEVKGVATAAGCQLVASCDLAVASAEARFATSGVNIGLFCSTPMVALTRNIARKFAMEMLLLGEFITARRAGEMGLVNRVVPRDELETESLRMARIIADKSPAAITIGKRAFYDQAEMTLDDAYAYTGQVMAENMLARDAKAGIAAFIGKAQMPEWTGE